MAAYLIAQIGEVRDPAAMNEYRAKIGATLEKYGGKFLVRGGQCHPVEGNWQPRLVIIEFPSVEQAHAWHDCAEYAPLVEIRQRAQDTQVIIAAGV